jgi:predicted  nucleic acid-binding Zn-ribbon protein
MGDSTPDDLDLSGLDARGAREYVLAFVKTLKETEQRKRRLAEEVRVWTDRVALARSKGREDLAAAAGAKVEALQPQLAETEAEEARLRSQVSELKDKLKLKIRGGIDRSVDTEKLEAELEMLVGDDGTSGGAGREPEGGLASAQAASELDELKKRLRGG